MFIWKRRYISIWGGLVSGIIYFCVNIKLFLSCQVGQKYLLYNHPKGKKLLRLIMTKTGNRFVAISLNISCILHHYNAKTLLGCEFHNSNSHMCIERYFLLSGRLECLWGFLFISLALISPSKGKISASEPTRTII